MSSQRIRPSFGVQVLIGMVIGLVFGFFARVLGTSAPGAAIGETAHVVGGIFVQLLKALVPPLVFTAIVASIAALRTLENAATLVTRTLLWFAITALIAVGIGIALGLLLQPGLNTSVSANAAKLPGSTGSWLDFLKGLVPANALGLAGSTTITDGSKATTGISFNVLQVIVAALAVGAAAVNVGAAGDAFLSFNASALAIFRRLLRWVIALTPFGSAALIADAIVRYGWDALSSLGAFAGAIYLGLALVLLVVYPAILLGNGLSPARFFATAWPAIQLGFLSRSSVGTLPVTEEVTERIGVPPAYAAFAVPVGATTKMDGCAAIYPAISAIFVAQFYGVPLHVSDYGLIVFVSVIGSAATAGLTGATVMLTLTLSTLGLPLEGAGLLLAIDPILDMGRTAVNVAGQVLVPTVVAKRAGILADRATTDLRDAVEPLPAE